MKDFRDLKLIIFDCDGVLFDSLKANAEFYNEIARRAGRHELSQEELNYCHMHTAEESIEFIFRHFPHLLKKAYDSYKAMDYGDFLKYMEIEPAMVETVTNLRSRFHTAISTNRSTTMPRLCQIYNLDALFDKIVCALDVKRPKPHPEGVWMILESFDLRPKNAVYIGDSAVDEEVSRNAGVDFIAYKNKELDAVFHVEHFSELSSFLMDVQREKGSL